MRMCRATPYDIREGRILPAGDLERVSLLETMSEADFERAADEVTRLKVRPGYPELAEVYSLYKQATVGDVNIQRPGMFDIPGKAKWDAWKVKEGMAKEDAVNAYIAVVEQLKAKYGL